MCLFDRIEVKHLNEVHLFVYLEDDRERSPDMHPVNLCRLMQTLYIWCSVRVLQLSNVVEDELPTFFRILLESLDDPSFDLYIQGVFPPECAHLQQMCACKIIAGKNPVTSHSGYRVPLLLPTS